MLSIYVYSYTLWVAEPFTLQIHVNRLPEMRLSFHYSLFDNFDKSLYPD